MGPRVRATVLADMFRALAAGSLFSPTMLGMMAPRAAWLMGCSRDCRAISP
ncbi:Uncharacterised protein [Mycobacteroides abscessus subsp. abscessus]|nr:Uncharacterised protein [Mycobacteroides abscessus subsp. abscessus]